MIMGEDPMRQPWKVVVVMLTGLLLACGADLSSGVGSGLALRASATGVKSITFSWRAISGATHYKLFVDPDGSSGFTQVGGDLTTTSTVVTIPVHLTDWLNARYLVEAHDAGGVIATSSSIGISSLMIDTIGYAKASNTWTGDNFGYRVAVSGDGTTMAVSAIGEDSIATDIDGSQTDDRAADSGAVYLFVRSGETWVQQAYIKASNTDAFDAFGSSLALSSNGDTLAVGATGEDSAASGIDGDQTSDLASNAGAVYLFARTGTTWSQQAYIKASNTDAVNPGDAFGTSVALSGDGNTLAVGASGEDSAATGIGGSESDNNASNAGAVYLFTRVITPTTTWSQQAYIKASNTDTANPGDAFGTSVALSTDGNTLAVGAPGEDSNATVVDGNETDNSAINAGAAYLFTRSGSTWSQQAYVKASNTEFDDAFGSSVTLSGDGTTLAVGAIGENSEVTGVDGGTGLDIAGNSGAVYVFALGASWTQQAYIKATNTGPADNFGVSVALSGDGNILAVGADQEDSNAQNIDGNQGDNSSNNAGAVYLYTRSVSVWSVSHYVKAPNTDLTAFDSFGDRFGASVAMTVDGNTLVVGAAGEDSDATGINGDMTNNNLSSAGAAYLY
jgi:hypothetical protein